jgi:hypothetical protein
MTRKYEKFYRKNRELVGSREVAKPKEPKPNPATFEATFASSNLPTTQIITTGKSFEPNIPVDSTQTEPNSWIKTALLLLILSGVLYAIFQNQSPSTLPGANAPHNNGIAQSREMQPDGDAAGLHQDANEEIIESLASSTDQNKMSGAAYHGIAQFKLKRARTEIDFNEAQDYLILAVSAGEALAAYELGYLHENGLVTNHSIELALQYYKTAAKAMSPNASYRLGMIYSTQSSSVDARAQALSYFNQAKSLGHPDASRQLDNLNQ